jgi:sugar phosphate permease
MGIGFGLAFAAMSGLIVNAVPAEQTGVASGMNANIRTIGGSIGAALMASIVTAQLDPSGLPKEVGYTVGFAMLTGALLVAAAAAVAIPSTREGELPADEPRHAELAILAGGTVVGDKPE